MNRILRRIVLFFLVTALVLVVVVYMQRREIPAARNAGPTQTPGMQLAVEKGCNACHTFDGSAGIGPTWKGTYGTLRIMTDGSERLANDAYLRQSMLEPAGEVVTGFENIMLPAELSEAEISQLIHLIRELGTSVAE